VKSNSIDDKCMEVGKMKIGEGTKEVDWETFFDHHDDSLGLLCEDFLHQSDGNGGAESDDIDDKSMEDDKKKIGEGTKEVDWETFFDHNDGLLDLLPEYFLCRQD
ncbi:hypothetical protein Ancab_001361, partial [Ancistrocladus abbreviatus]